MTTNYNFVVRNGLVVRGTDVSTSTTTGAVIVAGGVGVGGSLYATQIYEGTARVLTTATLGSFGVSAIYAGTGTAISTSTGAVTIWATGGGGGGSQTLQQVTDLGSTTTNALTITNNTQSTGTATGALKIVGGVGIGGNLYVGNSAYVGGSAVITTATLNTYVVQTSILAGTDTAVSTTTGVVSIWNTSTLQSITNRGSITTNDIKISSTTAATSTNTGALQVVGGVGIGGGLYAGQDSYIKGALVLTSATVNSYVAPSTAIFAGTDTAVSTSTGNVYIWNTSTLQSVTARGSTTSYAISITNPTSSISTTTGALTVLGGVGVGGNLYASALYDNGARALTTASISIFGVTSLTAGTGTAVSSSTGAITIWSSDDLQTITDRGSSTTNAVSILNTISSTNTDTDQALLVSGGIGANIIVASKFLQDGTELVKSVTPAEGIGIGIANLYSAGPDVTFDILNFGVTSIESGSESLIISANTGSVVISLSTSTTATYASFKITGTEDSISTNTGALQVVGGVGIGKSITVGNTASVRGTFYRTGNITAPDWQSAGIALVSSTATYTATALTGLQGLISVNAFGVPTLASTQTPIYSDAATVYIAGAPSQGAGVTITNPWSLYVASGSVKIAGNAASVSPTTGAFQVAGGVGIGGDLNVSGSGSFNTTGVTIGPSLVSGYTSGVISSGGSRSLDSFSTSTYRTARYTVQIVDGTRVHVAEMTLFHDNTAVYKNEYGITTNNGELGTFDATIGGGSVVLTFTPNYTPSAMTIKATRTAITS
jgi:hypothetical protein